MTIADFMELCVDPSFCKVEIYDTNKEETVWFGDGDEIPEKYGESYIESFDVPTEGCLTFNI